MQRFPLLISLASVCCFGIANGQASLDAVPDQKLDIRPLIVWPAKQAPPMKVSAALRSGSADVRETLHPQYDQLDWLTANRLALPPEEIVGLMLGNTFLASETVSLELDTFELGVAARELPATAQMQSESARIGGSSSPQVRTGQAIAGLAISGFLGVTNTPRRTVAIQVRLKVNGELYTHRLVGTSFGKTPEFAAGNALTAMAPALATCIEAVLWRQRGQPVRGDVWQQCT